MNNDISKYESLSAMQDGEISDAELQHMLKQSLSQHEKDAWDTYHLIADVLHSDDLAVKMSSDFSQRFADRFASEPVLLVPEAHAKYQAEQSTTGKRQFFRSYMAIASATAAAVFAFAFGPQLSHFGRDNFSSGQVSKADSSARQIQLVSTSVGSESTEVASADDMPRFVTAAQDADAQNQIDMVRDPRIDSYLLAHQRFSPAISNAAQYVNRPNSNKSASEK
ncbi:sigma-E factor negative regulatory protein [Undibacterium jejuense]|uniref:Sigma-E factor negative regulatory protein n=1 Tax=Undibacterium jejuense TaxID=1344949 RepID=A0A923HHF9_9BURK|nr:sigma-E factor negative regulatory protein [Undibacterium jejuense]MBC3862205.1 sigma-E factor negative regulatory protein [Undibacterium jejuense]